MAVSDHNPDHVEMDATHARQGRWGRHMFWVLLAGLVLAFAATLGVWAFRADDFAELQASVPAVEPAPQISNVTPTVEPGPDGG